MARAARYRSAEKLDVNICTQPGVIGQIPTNMIRIFVNYDLIAAPKPVRAELVVIWSDAEVETAKPKARRASTSKMPDVVRAKSPCKMAMGPRMSEVIVRIARSGVMPNPPTVRMNVGGVWMSGHVAKRAAWCGPASAGVRRGTMRRNEPMANLVTGSALTATGRPLRNHGNGKHQQENREKSESFFHVMSQCDSKIMMPSSSFPPPFI